MIYLKQKYEAKKKNKFDKEVYYKNAWKKINFGCCFFFS